MSMFKWILFAFTFQLYQKKKILRKTNLHSFFIFNVCDVYFKLTETLLIVFTDFFLLLFLYLAS